MYTRNKAEVSIGSDSVPVAAFDELLATDDGLYVRGWAFDPDTVNEAVSIQVYLNGAYWKTVVANSSRPDVHSAHGCGENHGFAFTIPVTEAGTYSVHLYAVNTNANAANLDMGAKEITITHSHSYKETYTQKTTCTTAGYTVYTCSGCGDSYTEYPGNWSQWSTQYPTGVPEGLIQTKTQYRSRQKEYATSTEATLDGWTRYDVVSQLGEYGPWSSWSDTAVSASETVQVEQRTVWGYYYLLCPHCGAHMHGYGTCYTWAGGCGRATDVSGFRELWKTTSWDAAGLMDWHGTGKYYTYLDGELVFKWTEGGSKNQYRSRTKEMVTTYLFNRWSDQWSDWSDEEISASEDCQVKTQTLYRYNTSAEANHKYTDNCDTSCNLCGTKREPKHTYISSCDASCGVCGAIRTNGSKHTLASNGICLHCNTTFGDVSLNSWQTGPVVYAYDRDLMAGKGVDEYGRIKFDPNSPITREEFVQVLYNAEGKPAVSIVNKFPDVGNSAWYKNAVLWANSKNIANGLGDGSFGVGKNITRQDLALMLYKYASLKGVDLTAEAGRIDQFADGDNVSGYAKTAMNWAVKNGVLSGKGEAGKPLSTFRLDPTGTATRAECAAMLKNFMTAFGL